MYIEQAYKGVNSWWRVLIVSLLSMGLFIANFAFLLLSDVDPEVEMDRFMALFPNKNVFLIVNLLPFAFMLGVLFFLVWVFHERNIMTLTTARKKIDFKRVFFGFGMVAVYTIVSFIIAYQLSPEMYVNQFDIIQFSILFLVGLVLFPFQIGLEEWLFRGYLMQQIGVAARNRWVPLIVTSVVFGLFHSANPEVTEMGPIIMVFYIGTGLLLGIMTLMDDGLELALGFHLGNNFLAATLLTYDYSALQTDAIFKSIAPASTGMEIVVPVLVMYPIYLFILAKKYKWTHWKEKLFGKVQPVVAESENVFPNQE